MTDTSKEMSAVGSMLAAAVDTEAAKLRLAKRAFDAVDAPDTIGAIAKAAKGGGKLSRSETVTVRLDPKLRYLAELAARIHRRTLSSYIEWSIESSLRNNLLTMDHNGPSIKDESEYLWDVDDADRFAKLALRYPHLLTHEEQVLWKLIRETVVLWRNGFPGDSERELDFEKLRRNWALVTKAAADGKTGAELDFEVN